MRIRRIPALAAATLIATALATLAPAGIPPKLLKLPEQAAAPKKELTLERLFPEKSIFGPGASGASFSRDGRWAAWLWRPERERRHGSDLWILDTDTGAVRRVTRASVMERFQSSARAVAEARREAAKKRRGGTSEAKPEAPSAAEDPVSGDWEGTATGGTEIGLPPEGVTITLALRRHDDGTVTGAARTATNATTLTDGRWDAAARRLTGTLEDEESGLVARLEATIDAKGVLTGTVHIEGTETTLAIEARRTKLDVADEGDADAETTDLEKTEGDDVEEEILDDADRVGDDDADDTKAPRYSGISEFTWAPEAAELLFLSEGDVYRMRLDDADAAPEEGIERLTRTKEREAAVQYLPDESGYTYLRSGSLIRVRFDSHLIEEIDPRLPNGRSMSGYRISPDGTRLAFVATEGNSYWSAGRTVKIISYRGRFAQVRDVPRHVSDDSFPRFVWHVYLYDLAEHLEERGEPTVVFSHEFTGPRDVVHAPEWSPDSSRVAFSAFEQRSGLVRVLEASMPDRPEPDDGEDEVEGDDGDEPKAEDDAETAKIEPARDVYRFFHNGGPNTPGMMRPLWLADGRRLLILTEISGFRHMHVLDPRYEQLEPLTRGRWELYPLDLSHDRERLYAIATREHPAREDLYRIDVADGAMTRLSTRAGTYSGAAVSDDGGFALASFADFGHPRELAFIDVAQGTERDLTDSHSEEAHALTRFVPEYFTYENRHGQEIHGHLFRPPGVAEGEKRPLLIYVYGGPLGRQKMTTRGSFAGASYFFALYMAQKHGFYACTIDPRGASGYGGLFEKSNYEKVGRPQVEDLVDGVRWMIENESVDPDRVALHGWSFGGFQTQMCLYTEPDVFACGIAGAGPTEWENYNSWYSTGTIGPSRPGEPDLGKFSLLPLAKNLKAKLLLVHGMEDSNVLYQDTVRVYRELLKSGKETLVELFLDPTGGHGLGGDVKSLGRYRKYEEFLLRCLAESAPDEEVADDEEREDDDAGESSGDDQEEGDAP